MGGGKGGANSQQAHDVVMTSMRRNDVASTSFRRHVLNRFLINQCQIITFLILKYDIIRKFKDRIERNSFAGTGGWIIGLGGGGGGGANGMLAPPSQIIGGAWPPPPPPGPPSSYAYALVNI